MMSIFWPIFWFGLILAAMVSTIVVAVIEQSKRKKALKASEDGQQKEHEGNDLSGSMESIDSFPAEENFEFSGLENK